MSDKVQNFIFTELEWDTNYFGVQCAKVDCINKLEESDKNEIIDKVNNYEFVTITNEKNNSYNNKFLGEKVKCYLTDVNIQLEKEIKNIDIYKNDNVFITNNKKYDKDIVNLASNIFENSRFLNDPNIDTDKADGLYKNWIKNSFDKEDKYFIYYKNENKICGFIIFNIKDQITTIELIAVNSTIKRQGIGSIMMRCLDDYSFNRGIRTLKVGTQIENINAINFYNGCGYRMSNIRYIYHCWKQ